MFTKDILRTRITVYISHADFILVPANNLNSQSASQLRHDKR